MNLGWKRLLPVGLAWMFLLAGYNLARYHTGPDTLAQIQTPSNSIDQPLDEIRRSAAVKLAAASTSGDAAAPTSRGGAAKPARGGPGPAAVTPAGMGKPDFSPDDNDNDAPAATPVPERVHP